jgi:preprotein translocase subunit SecG
MLILLTIVHFLVCVFLVVVVLLQSGKAADLAGAFGGMGSQTAFGPRGTATLLSKATTIAAVLFMLTSLTLSIVSTRTGGGGASVLERTSAPAAPAATPKQGQTPAPAPGQQPNVTVTPEGGQPGKPMPIDLNKAQRVDEKGNPLPPPQQQTPAPSAPAKK